MSPRGRDTLLSGLSFVIVLALVVSPAGAALRNAFKADDARRVDGVAASKSPRAGHLVPLGANRKLPRSTVAARRQARGARGPAGPAGLAGAPGLPGANGPEWVESHFGAGKTYVADAGGEVLATARSLPPGTYLALGSALTERLTPSYEEALAGCWPGNLAERGINSGVDVGFNAVHKTGMARGTVLGFGVFSSTHPQDITLTCGATNIQEPPTFTEPRLIVARVPSAWAQVEPEAE